MFAEAGSSSLLLTVLIILAIVALVIWIVRRR